MQEGILTNEREHSIPRNRNHQELENKYQAQASLKSIPLTDQTRKTEVKWNDHRNCLPMDHQVEKVH